MVPTYGWTAEFHQRAGVDPTEDIEARWRWVRTETMALRDAIKGGNRVDVARSIGELVRATYSCAVLYGINPDEAVRAMATATLDGLPAEVTKLERDPDSGRFERPPSYRTPFLSPALQIRRAPEGTIEWVPA